MNQTTSSSFENYDFYSDSKWLSYIDNVFPTPSKEQYDKIKKKWYKNNIDSSFDIDVNVSSFQSSSSQAKEESVNNKKDNKKEKGEEPKDSKLNQEDCYNHHHNHQKKGSKWILFNLEGYLKLFYLLIWMFEGSYSNGVAALICLLALLRQCKKPSWSKEYAGKLMFNEYFHNLWFILPFWLFTNQRGIVFYIPLLTHFWIGFCEFTNLTQNFFMTILQRPVEWSRINKGKLMGFKQKVEFYLLWHLIFFLFYGKTNLLIIILYTNYLRIKYVFNENLKNSFADMDSFIRKYIVRNSRVLGWLYNKVCAFWDYMVNPKYYTKNVNKKNEEKKEEEKNK